MVLEKMQGMFTKYEIARILGARALQLAMDAPMLLKMDRENLEKINYDVLKIAELEFEGDVLPITVKRPFPKRKEEKIKKISKEEAEKIEERKRELEKEKEQLEEKQLEKKEQIEEQKIREEGEIMELAKPADEIEEENARTKTETGI
jgi:DNA-directed RNA polymerase subunit K